MKRRTTQALAQLRTLAKSAVENLYQRIGLAAEVMADIDWIASVHGGSDLKAADALTDDYFRDLGGYISLGKLIAMYKEFGQDQWEESRYDVAAVEVLYDQEHSTRKTSEKGERTSWKKKAEERGERIESLERQITELVASNESLRQEVGELRHENGKLSGVVEELRRSRKQLIEA